MGFFQEFKTFINRGNVIDLAVGVVIGTAFGKIVSSLVADVIMPPIGLVMSDVNFANLKLPIGGKPDAPVTINYGNFIQTTIDFLVIAFAVFVFVRFINRFYRRQQQTAPPPAPSREEILLTEIRDLLKNK
ncbi:MAG: large-conductance mechanosensitive channel protein MscL [Verrucomicrobiia bacterium]